MDSHGGWIASTKDLARFIVKIDRNESKSDLISVTLLNKFYFGNPNWVHYGALPGASAILCRLYSTFSFAVLVNTCTDSNPSLLLDDLYNTVKEKIISISAWPSEDLF
jgi:hypothetical protein